MDGLRRVQDQTNPFEGRGEEYDAWFDTARGRAIFDAEVRCLRHFVTSAYHPWLEVGVGTGRFAEALGVEHGIDPSPAMLDVAARRGIKTRQGMGEELPYPDGSFGGVLMVVSLCFMAEPECALREAARVLHEDGRLVVGTVPAESAWGKEYAAKGEAGHPIYSAARFYRTEETIALIKAAGFEKRGIYSTLVSDPDAEIGRPSVYPGLLPFAGFVAMGFSLKDPAGHRTMENVPYHISSVRTG